MSVLLTSAKKSGHAKKAKKIKQFRVPAVEEEHRPPLSDAAMSVWFWDLNGSPTTVFFYKQKNEVWCNGFRVETYEGFVEGPDEFEDEAQDMEPGGIVDFTIFIAETQSSYQGRIRRLPARLVQGYSTHRLTVNDWSIPEHITYDYESMGGAGNTGDSYDADDYLASFDNDRAFGSYDN